MRPNRDISSNRNLLLSLSNAAISSALFVDFPPGCFFTFTTAICDLYGILDSLYKSFLLFSTSRQQTYRAGAVIDKPIG